MGVGRLNIWVSDIADPCGTWHGTGPGALMTILDCKGILEWPCGRYLAPDGQWQLVPNGTYANLPFNCGHLEVELPPGCYWAIAGYVSPNPGFIHLNYTTHVGIAEVGCDQTACVKLYNPTIRLCWDWFFVGLRMLTIGRSQPPFDPKKVAEIEKLVDNLMTSVPRLPVENVIEKHFDALIESAKKQHKG